MQNYKCNECGKSGVKLWAPTGSKTPKICAKCAEKRQSKLTYNEYVWEKNKRNAHLTGKKLPLPTWKVSEEGMVPSYAGPNADGEPFSYTSTLIIDFDDKETAFEPVYPDDESEDWHKLPTN